MNSDDKKSPLFKEQIIDALPFATKNKIDSIHAFEIIDSTNTFLLHEAKKTSDLFSICVANHQTKGRGRFEKKWHSPDSGNIYFSLLWRDFPIEKIPGINFAISDALYQLVSLYSSSHDLALKWPNDLLFQHKKLAGILIESVASPLKNKRHLVIGIGINLYLPKKVQEDIEQPVTDLFSITKKTIDRNQMIAKLIHGLIDGLENFLEHGVEEFYQRWQEHDALKNKIISMNQEGKMIDVKVIGVNRSGELMVEDCEVDPCPRTTNLRS